MTTADVAAALGIKDARVRQLVLSKRLTPIRRVRGAYLFSPEEVERFRAKPRRQGWPKGKPRKPTADAGGAALDRPQ